MSYKFVRITSYYPEYLNYFYERNPAAAFAPYNDQYTQLINDSFEIAGSYTKNLNQIGVAASDIISNASTLQNSWKKENDIAENTSSGELIIAQLKSHKPDVVWIDDFSFVNADWKVSLLKQVPSIKLFMGHICAPYNSEMEEKFKLLDIMFTCTPCFKHQLEKIGIKTHLLYHGFETSSLNNINTNNSFQESDFLFSGSLYTGSGFHKTRIEYIEKILEAGVNVNLYCNLESRSKVTAKKAMNQTIKTLKKIHAEKIIDKIPFLKKYKSYGDTSIKYYSKELIKRTKPPVFGYDMLKLLSKANITFNIHGEVAQKCAGNIRLFEATGVGSCLVTDWKENLNDLFETEKEIVTYKSIGECIDKVKWLLNNPEKRKKIANAGQEKTLAEHTIEKRAKTVNEIITKEMNKFTAL